MKKKLILILSILMMSTTTLANSFNDISSNFAKDEIEQFSNLGYFQNMIEENEKNFSPSKNMTRGEACILIINSLGIEVQNHSTIDAKYEDLNEIEEKYIPYVLASYEYNLMSGKMNNGKVEFAFNDDITKEEFLTILGNYFDFISDVENGFNDKRDISSWSKKYVNYFYENGLLVGDKNGNLNPKNNLRRDETVMILSNVINYGKENDMIVSKFIGNGKLGYENGSFENSTFTKITDIAFDSNYNLLLVDSLSNKIRSANINSYTTKDLVGNIDKLNLSGLPVGAYVDGAKEVAFLNKPENILISLDELVFFTEKETNSIRLYDDEQKSVKTFAGNKTAGYENGSLNEAMFNRPMGMAEDSVGNIYVADTLNHVIRKINRANGEVTLFAGVPNNYGNTLGNSMTAKFNEPVDLFIDDNDVIYIADAGNNAIKKIDNGVVSLVAGASTEMSELTQTQIGGDKDGLYTEAQLSYPMGVYVYDDVVYVADTYNNKIKKIQNNVVTTIAGSGEIGNDLGDAKTATFNKPMSIIALNDRLYIADSDNQTVKIIDLR